MLRKPKIIADAYRSYRGDDESHLGRLVCLVVVAALIATYAGNLSEAALPAMALAVSVLAGFTFTALFSSGSLSTNDLPEPTDESDREDRNRLEDILENFRVRSRLFLLASVLCLGLVLLISIPLDWGVIAGHISCVVNDSSVKYLTIAQSIHEYLSSFIVFITFFIFSEMLHLFYRLAESIFSILDIRRKYLASH